MKKADAERRQGWEERLRMYRESVTAAAERTREILEQPLEQLQLTQFGGEWLEHRSLAIAAFVLDGSAADYCFHMSLSVRWHTRLISEADRRGADTSGYRSLQGAMSILDAWSCGDHGSAGALADVLSSDTKVRERDCHPFMRCFARAVLALARGEECTSRQRVEEFAARCEKDGRDFAAYASLMRLILDGESNDAQQALADLCAGHRRQSLRGLFMNDPADQLLCVWGLGLARRAREKGIALEGVEPLVPSPLLHA